MSVANYIKNAYQIMHLNFLAKFTSKQTNEQHLSSQTMLVLR